MIQPHLPIRLPCYDFVPLTPHNLDSSLPKVRIPASAADNSGGVTGGVYKARERIQRSLADLRLLAIPTSCSRVADCNLNWECIFEICSTSRYCVPLFTHCSMCVAPGVRAMLTWRHPHLPPTYIGSFRRVPDFTLATSDEGCARCGT